MQKFLDSLFRTFKRNPKVKYTSLFKGFGFGEFYLKKELNMVCVLGNEINQKRAQWCAEVEPDCEMVVGDIYDPIIFNRLVKLHKEKGATGVCASPSCQSYTNANIRRNPSDKRGLLFEPTLEFIRQTDPEWVMIENVPPMLTIQLDDGRIVGQFIVKSLENMGYIVNYGIQNAADFGTPQNRQRAIILARKNKAWLLPTPHPEQRITLWEAIGDLPSLESGQASDLKWHVAPVWAQPQIEVMRHTPTGCSAHDNLVRKPVRVNGLPSKARFKCSFSRKSWDQPSNTILTDSKSISGFRTCHPGRLLPDGTYSDARALTILELLRITGLPDDYPIPEWASDRLIRAAFGECFAAKHVLSIMKGLN